MKNLTTNRNFGLVFFTFFLAISLIPYFFYNKNINLIYLIISLIFLILGLFNSKILTPLNNLWFKFGLLLAKIFSPVIMSVIFFMIITPLSLILRLFNKDILNLKKNNNSTYWKKRVYRNKMTDQF